MRYSAPRPTSFIGRWSSFTLAEKGLYSFFFDAFVCPIFCPTTRRRWSFRKIVLALFLGVSLCFLDQTGKLRDIFKNCAFSATYDARWLFLLGSILVCQSYFRRPESGEGWVIGNVLKVLEFFLTTTYITRARGVIVTKLQSLEPALYV